MWSSSCDIFFLLSMPLKSIEVLEFDLWKVTLVGHSLGGFPLSYAMEMYPTKISKVIFIAAFTPWNNQTYLRSSSPKVWRRHFFLLNLILILTRCRLHAVLIAFWIMNWNIIGARILWCVQTFTRLLENGVVLLNKEADSELPTSSPIFTTRALMRTQTWHNIF